PAVSAQPSHVLCEERDRGFLDLGLGILPCRRLDDEAMDGGLPRELRWPAGEDVPGRGCSAKTRQVHSDLPLSLIPLSRGDLPERLKKLSAEQHHCACKGHELRVTGPVLEHARRASARSGDREVLVHADPGFAVLVLRPTVGGSGSQAHAIRIVPRECAPAKQRLPAALTVLQIREDGDESLALERLRRYGRTWLGEKKRVAMAGRRPFNHLIYRIVLRQGLQALHEAGGALVARTDERAHLGI